MEASSIISMLKDGHIKGETELVSFCGADTDGLMLLQGLTLMSANRDYIQGTAGWIAIHQPEVVPAYAVWCESAWAINCIDEHGNKEENASYICRSVHSAFWDSLANETARKMVAAYKAVPNLYVIYRDREYADRLSSIVYGTLAAAIPTLRHSGRCLPVEEFKKAWMNLLKADTVLCQKNPDSNWRNPATELFNAEVKLIVNDKGAPETEVLKLVKENLGHVSAKARDLLSRVKEIVLTINIGVSDKNKLAVSTELRIEYARGTRHVTRQDIANRFGGLLKTAALMTTFGDTVPDEQLLTVKNLRVFDDRLELENWVIKAGAEALKKVAP